MGYYILLPQGVGGIKMPNLMCEENNCERRVLLYKRRTNYANKACFS